MGSSIPEMQLMMNVLFVKETAEIPVVVEEGIVIADREHDLELAQLLQPPSAGQAGQEMRRGVEIDVLVVITVEQVAEALDLHRQIITAGKGSKLAEEMRMPQHKTGGLKG